MESIVPEKDVAELDAKQLEEELNKNVGVAVDYSTMTRNNLFKFLIFSAIGVWVFFIPTNIGGVSNVPMVLLIDAVKALLGSTVMNWMVLILCIALSVTFTISRIQMDGPIHRFHKKDGWGTGILYYLSAVFAVMVVFNVGPSQIVNDSVGIEAIGLAGSTLLTVTIAGWLVNFLIEFGILEFIGTLMEPIMRKVFKLPGQSAVTAVSAFVAAPAVGVFMTDRLYHENVYTHKEACCVATNFSVVSLGFFALLVTITDTQYMYGKVVISSLVIVFILAAIVIRIPPLSRKKDRYYNGVEQTAAMRKSSKYSKDTMKKAVAASTTKVSQTPYSIFVTSIPGVLSFTVKIVTFVQALATIALFISNYTPFFDWIGMPMVPYLELCQMPDAAAIAPATLVGIAEIALPVMTIAGMNIAPMSIFFVIVLSTVQIIFFTESANAMMQSDLNLKFPELVLIFLIRTLIAIPIVAVFAHVLF